MYRHPDTGRFITRAEWEMLQAEHIEEFEDFDDLNDWDFFEEEELY